MLLRTNATTAQGSSHAKTLSGCEKGLPKPEMSYNYTIEA